MSTKLADSPQVEKIKLINNPELISLQKSSELTPDIVNNKELSPKEIIDSHVMLQEISQIPLRLQKYFSHDFPALFSPDNQIILVNKWLKMEEANRTNNQLIWKIREAKFKIENMAIKPDDHIKPLVKHASSSELEEDEGEKTIAYSSVAQEPRSDSTCDLSAEYESQKETIVNSGEFGARSNGATSDDVTNFSSIDYSVANQIASLPISKELDPAKVSNPTFSDNLIPEAECSKSMTPILTPNISIAPLQNGQNHVIISSPEIMDEGNSSSSLIPFPKTNHHVAVLHELPSSPTNMYSPVQGTHTPNANLVLGDGIIPPETTPEIGKSKQTITNSSSWSYKAPFSYLSFLAHKATEFVHNITSLVQKELECSSTFSSSFDYSAESLQLAGDSADPLEGNIIVYKYLL
ncbi:hypothetical protein [Candidatus Tisiphia endosymbiont of Beris chalybata]|uniref:hypothetical protein n=1 Tax=Candidatus Tisiphia endosymbiont of Beris chalybata TaxID=3066262 RepID=UPI00312CA0E4